MLKREEASLSELRSEIREFLDSDNPAMRSLRHDIIERLSKLGNVYVIGGLIRDLAIFGLADRPISDVDLVVRCNRNALAKFAQSVGAVENRFGGFGLRTNSYRVDFWAFANTWAKTAGHVNLTKPSDLWKTTFFDWDAVVFGYRENEIWAIDSYLDKLKSGYLEVNLLPNPSPLGSLVRALRRLMMWDARPKGKLRHFIDENLQEHAWPDILAAEAHAFHVRFLDEFISSDEYMNAVMRRSIFRNLGAHARRQDKLPGLEQLPDVRRQATVADKLKLTTVNPKPKKRKRYLAKDLFGNMR